MLNPYLFFDGNALEAMEFYRSVFGGDFATKGTFAEIPEGEMQIPEEYKSRIMHISYPIGASVLMASDSLPGMGPSPTPGTNFSISIAPESRARADEIFGKLAEGGEARMPMHDSFWGAYFGVVSDKFGISWMINCEAA